MAKQLIVQFRMFKNIETAGILEFESKRCKNLVTRNNSTSHKTCIKIHFNWLSFI